MDQNKIVRFLHSLVILPVLATAFPLQAVKAPEIPAITVLSQQQNSIISDSASNKKTEQEIQAKKIDAYFADRNMPLEGFGAKMIEEAEKNDIDWRLLPAIAVRESSGGIHACKRVPHNFFGWGSCKIGFKDANEAIETIARNLGGNNPRTAKHYDGKTLRQILNTYNGLAVLQYADQVMDIMNTIENYEIPVASSSDTDMTNA